MRAAVLGIVVSTLLAFLPAEGQVPSLESARAGMSLGFVWKPAALFSPYVCQDDHPTAYRLHGGLSLTGITYISAGVSRVTDNPPRCDTAPIPPIPDEGPHTRRSSVIDPDVEGYPYTAIDVQLGVHAESEAGDARAGIGPVWFPGKDLLGMKLTVEGAFRIRDWPLALLLGFDQSWLGVRYTESVFNYQDGELESVELTPKHAREQIRVLRLGLEVRR